MKQSGPLQKLSVLPCGGYFGDEKLRFSATSRRQLAIVVSDGLQGYTTGYKVTPQLRWGEIRTKHRRGILDRIRNHEGKVRYEDE